MSNAGREIAAAPGALPPELAADVIFRSLFENGPNRMSSANKFIAKGVIQTALIEWRKQILDGQDQRVDEWKKRYEAAKAELDDVKLKLALLQKEK